MKKLICNPINLDYRYQVCKQMGLDGAMHDKSVYRKGADPTVILFKDHYLLFVSMSGGFWYSEDLYDWQYKATPELPINDYAPDVAVVNGEVVFSASKRGEKCTFFKSADPINKSFVAVSSELEYWDPHTFQDDDGRVYFYWGCSSTDPLYGVELDPINLTPIGEQVVILGENEAIYGWERMGENNAGLPDPKNEMEAMIRAHIGNKPFIEGAFVNKHEGKYYFQYAGPGTQYNVYADGVYVGNSPMGPFNYQPHNPFSSKPGGFITGAGHGSTFPDKYGNMWHASTMRISVNDNFERRIGIFPRSIDADGIMHCNQHFADYPFHLPQTKVEKIDDLQPAYMLLSFNADVSVSSEQVEFEAANAVNEDIRSWWAANTTSQDEFLQIDLGAVKDVAVFQLNFADHQTTAPGITEVDMVRTAYNARYIVPETLKTAYLLEGSVDGSNWEVLVESTDGAGHDLITLDAVRQLRFVRVSNIKMPFDAIPAISGLRVFGNGNGEKPAPVTTLTMERIEEGLSVNLDWHDVDGAEGYNVRYGTRPDKLYSSWQVTESKLRLSTLNSGQVYYIAVDSYNENGITKGEILCLEA